METDFIITSTLATEKNEAPAAASEDVKKNPAAAEDHEAHEATHEDQETQDDDQDLDSHDDDNQEEKPRPKNGFKKRVDRERRKVAERDQRIAALEAELAKRNSSQDATASVQTNSDQEPNPDNFDTVADYNKAVIKWELKQERLEREKQEKVSKEKTYHDELKSKYEDRRKEFVKTVNDFEDVVADFADKYGDFKASPAIVEALLSSEFGPEIFYQVVKDHGEYERLSQMPDVAIIRELGKIEARLALAKESQSSTKPKMSKAPAPVSKLSGGTVSTTKSLSDPDISFAEYEQIRMKQLKQK